MMGTENEDIVIQIWKSVVVVVYVHANLIYFDLEVF